MILKGKIPDKKEPEINHNESEVLANGRKFVIVTADFSGAGFAKQAVDAGLECIMAYKPKEGCEDEAEEEEYLIQGEGIFEKLELDELMDNREDYRDWYFIWDGNHNYEEGEMLITEGFKVFGGTKFTYDLENDREFGMEFAEAGGLCGPETHEFSSAEEGIAFLEQNEDKAYVFKPNDVDDNSLTYVPVNEEPANANLEVRQFIEAFKSHKATSDYVLQEMVKGVEVNVEAFYYKGEPYFCHANFEDKFSHQHDSGEATGCAFDIEFEIPLDSRLYKETVGKLEEQYREISYTGLADANVIVGEGEVYFLEFCNRLGYNAAPNTFFNLFKKPAVEVIADMIDGITETDVRPGFGASMTVFTEKHKMGLPIYYPESMDGKVFLFDGYKEDDVLKMGGIGHEICIVCEHGYTIDQAMRNVIESANKVIFKNSYFRRDAAGHDYKLNPHDRYNALMAIKMI